MIYLTARNLSRQFDSDPIFQDVTFDVRLGERIGLVGPNGSGKTTLLRILNGDDVPDVGEVEHHGSSTWDMLKQQTDFPPDRTLYQEAKSGLKHLYDLQERAEQLTHQLAEATAQDELEKLQRLYDALHQELERHGAYNIDYKVNEVLEGLGFSKEEFHRPLQSFSGGQQNRVLLARLLLKAPDVMLLDEPTNHLDIAATEWLEKYLASTNQALILVSHDRYFLDKVTTRILEIHSGKLTDYPGNFSSYWKLREERKKATGKNMGKATGVYWENRRVHPSESVWSEACASQRPREKTGQTGSGRANAGDSGTSHEFWRS